MDIQTWLAESTTKLQGAGIESARLDCLILLEYITKRDRAWILANQNISLDATHAKKLDSLLGRRLQREPIAYIIELKEFMGLELKVTPDVLIPRPETEQLIELFAQLKPAGNWEVADIGTGSGAVGLAVKQLYPEIIVTATDVSDKSLGVAKQNAQTNRLEVSFIKTNLLDGLGSFDVIIANLPYVDAGWEVSPETKYEPTQALYANQDGLELIYSLLEQAHSHLKPGGYVILEHDPRQAKLIEEFAESKSMQVTAGQPFATVLRTTGQE